MGLFENALADIYESEMAIAAVYTPPGGESVDVKVIPALDHEVTPFGETQIHSRQSIFTMAKSYVASPVKGAILTANGKTYKIKSSPRHQDDDPDALEWLLECTESSS